MPIIESDLVRNQFFTYYIASKSNGATTAETRKLDQIFNYDGVTVQVNGSYQRGTKMALNVFGKKHILATRVGGKDVADKAASIHAKRQNPMSILSDRNKKFKALKVAAGTGANTLSYGTQPTKDVYGTKFADDKIPSTFFLIDNLSPDEVRAVFTSAITAATCAINQDTDIELVCGAGHVGQLTTGSPMDTTSYTKIKVRVYFDGMIYNVNHCLGPVA